MALSLNDLVAAQAGIWLAHESLEMDIARPSQAKQRRNRRIIYGAAGIALVALVTMGLSKLKPAAPSVERSTVWIDTVKRGPMLRQVRGLGTLVPVDIRWIPAVTEGRVDRILVLPGSAVKADTVLLEPSNPQLQQEALDAEWKLKAPEADYKNLEVIEQKKYALGASTSYQVLQTQRDLAQAESNLVSAMSAYEKSRVELDRVTGLTLSRLGIQIQDAESGHVQTVPTLPGVEPRPEMPEAERSPKS